MEAKQIVRSAITVLRRLVHICHSCKRIRDVKGLWVVACVVRNAAGLSISHGLCPECARRLYPDYFSE